MVIRYLFANLYKLVLVIETSKDQRDILSGYAWSKKRRKKKDFWQKAAKFLFKPGFEPRSPDVHGGINYSHLEVWRAKPLHYLNLVKTTSYSTSRGVLSRQVSLSYNNAGRACILLYKHNADCFFVSALLMSLLSPVQAPVYTEPQVQEGQPICYVVTRLSWTQP